MCLQCSQTISRCFNKEESEACVAEKGLIHIDTCCFSQPVAVKLICCQKAPNDHVLFRRCFDLSDKVTLEHPHGTQVESLLRGMVKFAINNENCYRARQSQNVITLNVSLKECQKWSLK